MDSKTIGRVLSRVCGDPIPTDVRICLTGVTIAIPNWNHEFVLPRSIGSALRAVKILREHQVCAEILVIDDHSRDGSLMLLRQLEALYSEEGLRVLALTRNVGLQSARNQALLNATYRYIAFMDADNELIPENLYQFYRAITQTRAAIVYGNLIWQGQIAGKTALISNESFQDRIFEVNYIDAFALVDRLQMLDSGGYLESMPQAWADWELYLHLASNGRSIIFVPMIFGIYYDTADSMLKEANEGHATQQANMRRTFNQLGIRECLPLNTRHLRYHPDIGYI